jgi:hypothetical protein
MTDTVLILAWLVFAHLVADFVLQNDWIALNKGQAGRRGWEALAVHGFHVGLCLLPAVLAYGLRGVVYLVVAVASHVLVDRWKVMATRRSERQALDAARKRLVGTGEAPESGLGSAWTPWPGMLFVADQALHLTIALVGWLVILEGVPLQPVFVDAVNLVLRSWDRAAVHAVTLTAVVLVSLFLVNTRAAYYFVLALVSPREIPGPTDAQPSAQAPDPSPRPRPSVPSGAPARIGATIGALERLLIVVFVLVGAEAAVGFVIAAKTIARFKQLDDRGFAEYYLLGTLASVSVAIVSAIVAKAALGTIP